MAAGVPAINPLVSILTVLPIRRRLGYFFYSTKYFEDMHDNKTELNAAATDMRNRMEGNNVRNVMVPRLVPSWLERAEEIDREIDSISAGGNGFLHIPTRYKAGKRCYKVNKRIERLMTERSNMIWTDEQIPLGIVSSATPQVPQDVPKKIINPNEQIPPGMVSSATPQVPQDVPQHIINPNEQIPPGMVSSGMVSSATPQVLQDVTQNIFDSRKEIFQRALQLLEPDNPTQMVALCGMGGIGKTTMMEELKKVVENRKQFDRVVRVVIGNKTDPIAFQDAIAHYVGGNLSESTKKARADRLKERFLGMSQDGKKKILIILDDVWNIVDINDIGLEGPLPKGFKLFLTSRDEKLCDQMAVGTNSILKMVGLKGSEATQLFWKTTALSNSAIDRQQVKLGEDIVKRCGGLPMAIKTIALALKGEIKDAWELTLLRLNRHDLRDLYAVVNDIFEISYNYLKKDDQKIFILSGLFPDDFDIPLEDLMRYGWGLKLFDNVPSLFEARLQTNVSVHNLIRANLLVESDQNGCVKMHDLARSFILSKISEFKQASIVNHRYMSEWPTQDTRESCEKILVMCKGMSEFPQHFDYSDLKLLKLMIMSEKEPLKFPEDFYTRMEKLQVISYRSIQYPPLPISLQCSTSLRMLCLRSCSLNMGDLSYLGHLSNLEILSFAYCRIKNLPSTMGNLTNLKLLDLTGCDELCIGDGVFQKLYNLEDLYLRNWNYKVFSFTEDNCKGLEMVSKNLLALELEFFKNNFLPNRVSFNKLERFRISIGCHLDHIYDNDVYSFENTLRLVASCEEVRAFKINELFEKTEKLHLQVKDINHLEDVLMHPSNQYSFCNLKHLSFEMCANLKYLFSVNVASTLTNLETLRVSSCCVLEYLIHGDNNRAEVIKFHKLKRLVLDELLMFVGLCDNINIVMELPQLIELRLAYLPNFTCIFASSCIISDSTKPLLNKEVVSPKLEELEIRGLKNLKEIWACEVTSSEEEDDRTLALKEIEVDECDEIQNLFPRNPMRLLSHLEMLVVINCGSIQALFDIDSECVGQVNSSLRSIRALGLGKLRDVWRIRGEENSGLVIPDFQSLEFIQINQCENFRNIVIPTTIKFDMGALIDITIDLSEEKWGTNDRSVEFIQDEENEILEVDDSFPRVAVSSSFIHSLHHVANIKLCMFKQAEVIFDIQIPTVDNVTPNDDEQPLILPCLTDLKLSDMKSMTHLWKCNWSKFLRLHNNQQKSSFQNLTTIYLENCDIIEYLFSPLIATLLYNLKKVDIHKCKRIQEVVSNRDDDDEESTTSTSTSTTISLFPSLDCLTLHNLENLKCIGRGIKMPNLKTLDIKGCHRLVNIFTFSTLGSLGLLEKLSIKECEELKVIVREEHGEQTTTTSKAVIFPFLKSIILADLPNLKGFFIGMNEFQLSLLAQVVIKSCHQMMVLTPLPLRAPKLKYIHINGGKYSLFMMTTSPQTPSQSSDNTNSLTSIPAEILSYSHSLIEMNLGGEWKRQVIFPYDELLQLQNLEKLDAIGCESVVEVFDIETGARSSNSSQTVVKLPKLSDVRLWKLMSLKYIWRSNGGTTLEFPNLTKLFIYECNRLEHVFTSSMVGSLLQLKELRITWCQDMEVIVKEDQEEEEEKEEEGGDIGKVNEIIRLPCLKSLYLESLPSLKGFCLGNVDYSFPSLDRMEIFRCESLTTFTKGGLSVPELKVIETSLGRKGVPNAWTHPQED